MIRKRPFNILQFYILSCYVKNKHFIFIYTVKRIYILDLDKFNTVVRIPSFDQIIASTCLVDKESMICVLVTIKKKSIP